jgi:deoxycytidylate deaminase
VNISGATLYVSASPCWECFKVLANCGIKLVCFGEFYRNENVLQAASQVGIEMIDLSACLPSKSYPVNSASHLSPVYCSRAYFRFSFVMS